MLAVRGPTAVAAGRSRRQSPARGRARVRGADPGPQGRPGLRSEGMHFCWLTEGAADEFDAVGLVATA